MDQVIRVELREAQKVKLSKRKECDYCRVVKPKYILDGPGIMRNVVRLPNGTFRCAKCAFDQASKRHS